MMHGARSQSERERRLKRVKTLRWDDVWYLCYITCMMYYWPGTLCQMLDCS
jgi:hypothetical protein